MNIVVALKYTVYIAIVKLGYNSFVVFSFFYKVLQMCYFIFSVNERVVVIKQPIMVLPVEKQYELSPSIVLKHQMNFRWGI